MRINSVNSTNYAKQQSFGAYFSNKNLGALKYLLDQGFSDVESRQQYKALLNKFKNQYHNHELEITGYNWAKVLQWQRGAYDRRKMYPYELPEIKVTGFYTTYNIDIFNKETQKALSAEVYVNKGCMIGFLQQILDAESFFEKEGKKFISKGINAQVAKHLDDLTGNRLS